MYRGFNLKLDWYDEDYYKEGLHNYSSMCNSFETKLNSFVLNNGYLDGKAMQNNWFPQISADIFISHSHKDLNKAIAISAWLKESFNLNSFIDSCVWDYSDRLLKLIDDKYCKSPDGQLYSYELRNRSTSHVHMMLSTALNMMMDKTECLFFLNTYNSISISDSVNRTESPWLYHEIAASQLIRKNPPLRYLTESQKHFSFEGGINDINKAELPIQHEVDLRHLTDIDIKSLNNWLNSDYKHKSKLDILYILNPENGR